MKAIIKRLFTALTTYILTSSSKSIVGFSRLLLAAGVLLKLLFNNIDEVITPLQLQNHDLHSLKYRCNFFLIFNSSHLVEMKIVAIIILVFVITGYFIKVTAMLHFWIAASFFMLRPVSIGVDNIDMLLTLLLVPVCLFDERRNHWHQSLQSGRFGLFIQYIFLFIIKLQVAFIYYDSFHDKLFVKEWLNGTVIYYWFTHNFFGLHPLLIKLLEPLLTNIPVLIFLSWSTLAFEAVLAIAFLFASRYRLLLLKCGVIFHFSILLIHGFSFLFFVMSAALFLYLYPPKKSFSLLVNEQ